MTACVSEPGKEKLVSDCIISQGGERTPPLVSQGMGKAETKYDSSAFGPSFRRHDPALLPTADSLTCVVACVILRSPEIYVVKEKLVKNGPG